MIDFGGKTVAITGAASDVGQGCAKDFARHGAHVILIDSHQSVIDELSDAIRESGGKATAVQANPSNATEMVEAAERCAISHVLVTCPMDMEFAPIETSSFQSWERVIANNLLGPVYSAKAFLPLLRQQSGAAVIHLGSIDGTLGNPTVPSYSASKGGIVALTHVMAEEFSRYGIRVNCVARAMLVERGSPPDMRFAPLLPHTPLGRPGYYDEVAAAVRFLASAEASYITGAVLPVDGGRTGITPGTRRT